MTLIPFTIPPELAQILGLFGFGLFVLCYVLLAFNTISSRSCAFFAGNLLAGTFALLSLPKSADMTGALLILFWIGISVVGIVLRLSDDRRTA